MARELDVQSYGARGRLGSSEGRSGVVGREVRWRRGPIDARNRTCWGRELVGARGSD